MTKEEFIIHACEQVLRFSRANTWDELSEERKVQLGFNIGAMKLGLALTKEEGFISLSDAMKKNITMPEFHSHLRSIIKARGITVDEYRVLKEF